MPPVQNRGVDAGFFFSVQEHFIRPHIHYHLLGVGVDRSHPLYQRYIAREFPEVSQPQKRRILLETKDPLNSCPKIGNFPSLE